MGEWLGRLARDLRSFVAGLPVAQRISFMVALLLLLAATAGVWFWTQRPDFQTLFSNLEEADASAIVAYLKDEKIPYRIAGGGTAVQVPAEKVLETRLALAARGLPQGGGVGFEIFDRQALGMTDFVQRLNFQRALQGELARTISQLSQVEGARVHLVMPERSFLSGEQALPGASVVLKLKGGQALRPAQVRGIAHLVASSVQGLKPADVTIVDAQGTLLNGPGPKGEDQVEEPGIVALKRRVEGDYEKRIESMLERVVGQGKAIARVTVDLDLTRVERTQVTFDPDAVVVGSEKRIKERTVGEPLNAGVPGVESNITNEAATERASASGPTSEHEDEAIEYEVSRTTSHITEPMGGIKHLSVAVLIDGTYREEGGKRTYVPRSEEEIGRLRELVKRAVGFNEKRGDEIEVTSAAFELPAEVEAGKAGWSERLKPWVQPAFRLFGVLGLLGVIMFVVRPFLLALARRPPVGGVAGQAPALFAPGAAAQIAQVEGGGGAESVEFARRNPDRTAELIKHWMIEHGG